MTFVPTDKLKAGMILDRDVYLVDSVTSKIIMLRSGQMLTELYVNKFSELDILGAYIQSSDEKEKVRIKTDIRQPIKRELKQEAIENVHQV